MGYYDYESLRPFLELRGYNLNINLDTHDKIPFNEIEFLKSYPEANALMMNFADLFQSMFDENYDDIRLFEPNFSFLDSEDFKQRI
jgi:hypothetical protein